MMHYRKGDNVEQELSKSDLPFNDCMPKGQEQNFLWMHVKGGTTVSNVITYAKNALDKNECRTVVWSGAGGGVVKTISCAEILKRDYPLYQVTRMCYSTIEEHWLPQMDGLEEIVVNRKIPTLHILMSLDAIDDKVSGLQKPGTTTDFWVDQQRSRHNTAMGNGAQRRQQHGKRGNARGPFGAQQQLRRTKSPKGGGGGDTAGQGTSAQQQVGSMDGEQQLQQPRGGGYKGKSKHKNRHSNAQQQQQNTRQPQAKQQQTSEQPEPMSS